MLGRRPAVVLGMRGVILRHVLVLSRVMERRLPMMVRGRLVMTRRLVVRGTRVGISRARAAAHPADLAIKLATVRCGRFLAAAPSRLLMLFRCSASLRHIAFDSPNYVITSLRFVNGGDCFASLSIRNEMLPAHATTETIGISRFRSDPSEVSYGDKQHAADKITKQDGNAIVTQPRQNHEGPHSKHARRALELCLAARLTWKWCRYKGTQETEEIDMGGIIWTIIAILVVLWALGLIVHVGGSLIHILLVLALVIFIINLFTGRSRLA